MGPWSLSRDVVWAFGIGAAVAGCTALYGVAPIGVWGATVGVGLLVLGVHQVRVARPLARLYAAIRASRHGQVPLPEPPGDPVVRRQFEMIRGAVEGEDAETESTWIEDGMDPTEHAIYRSGGRALALALRAASESSQMRAGLSGLAQGLNQACGSEEGAEALDGLREAAEAEAERLRQGSAQRSHAVAEFRGALRQVSRRLAELVAAGKRLTLVEQGCERVDQHMARLEASELPAAALVPLAEARAQLLLQRQTLGAVQEDLRECAERLEASRFDFTELQPDLGPLVSAFLAAVATLEAQSERWQVGLRAAARSARAIDGSVQVLFEVQPELHREIRELELAWAEMKGPEAFSSQLLDSLRWSESEAEAQAVARAAEAAQRRLDHLMDRLEAAAHGVRES